MADTLFAVDNDTTTIRATITRLVYHERGRVIARVQLDPSHPGSRDEQGRRRSITAVLGSMIEPLVGQLYEFSGRVEFDDRFKQHQLKFDSYRTILPTDRDGIASYLIDVAKWVGPSTARALVDTFGSDTLQVLREEPERVVAAEIPGLTEERVREMQASLQENADLEAASVEVNNLLGGVLGPATVRRAIKKWRSDAATIIRRNPYELTALHGVGFLSADAVARKLAVDPSDLRRHAAALSHILHDAAGRQGHTVLSWQQVQMEASKLLGLGGLRPEVLDACQVDESIESDGITIAAGGLRKAERYVAEKIAMIIREHDAPAGAVRMESEPHRAHLFPPIDTEGLAEDQAAAVATLQNAAVGILCGAPGTGKTYTVARIVKSLQAAGLRIALAAPTGKAAKQMSLALGGGHAVTIHSLLEPTVDEDTGEFYFARNESNPIDYADVIIIDEVSMVDILLMQSLLRAIPLTSRLLLVGDHYQLPSVGPGAVLRDLLRAGVPHFELRQIKRNAGRIVHACHAFKDGRTFEPAARLDLDAGDNWRHIDAGSPDEIKEIIAALIRDKLPADLDRLWQVQTISPTNEKGELSCESLNTLIKDLVNPRPCEDKLPFGAGDKVVRLKNGKAPGVILPSEEDAARGVQPIEDTSIRIVNGDIGIVTGIDRKEITVRLRYPDRIVRIKRTEHHLRLAYCMTCHKLQGSECEVVILPLHRSLANIPMVTREWIYTAFSRAKRFIVTVGDVDAISPMLIRVGTGQRQTVLQRLLEGLLLPPAAGSNTWEDL